MAELFVLVSNATKLLSLRCLFSLPIVCMHPLVVLVVPCLTKFSFANLWSLALPYCMLSFKFISLEICVRPSVQALYAALMDTEKQFVDTVCSFGSVTPSELASPSLTIGHPSCLLDWQSSSRCTESVYASWHCTIHWSESISVTLCDHCSFCLCFMFHLATLAIVCGQLSIGSKVIPLLCAEWEQKPAIDRLLPVPFARRPCTDSISSIPVRQTHRKFCRCALQYCALALSPVC